MKLYQMTRLIGSVCVSVSCRHPERLVQILSSAGCTIWNLTICEQTLTFCFPASSFPAFEKAAKKTHSSYDILKKEGICMYARSLKKMYGILIGCVFCMLLLSKLTKYVWDISVLGEKNYTEKEITEFLEENEIYYGMPVSEIDFDQIEQKIRKQYFDIAWVNAELKGTRLMIHIKEGENLDHTEVAEKKPCDLVAARDGIIRKLVVRRGTPLVKLGDEVKKGQILISGQIPCYNDANEVTGYQEVEASADLAIEGTLTIEGTLSKNYQKKVYTGNIKTQWYASINGKAILARFHENEFENYDEKSTNHQLKILRNLYLPVKCGIIEYNEFRYENATYSPEELKHLAMEEIQEYEKKKFDSDVKIISRSMEDALHGTRYIYRMNYRILDTHSMQAELTRREQPTRRETE